jgi:glyoxylase I family protein
MIRGIHHVSISTQNMDRIVRFYSGVLGCPVVIDTEISGDRDFDTVVGLPDSNARVVFLQAGNAFIEFWEYVSPQGRGPIPDRPVNDVGVTHICFEVEEAQAVYEVLSAQGVPFVSEPQDLGTVITCYARDPDGNVLEIRQGKNPRGLVEITPDLMALAKANRG